MGTLKFHRRCGDRVSLLNDNTTALRNFVEFNHGLILSAEPLEDDVIFEVCIDKKVSVWNGSLEIGVTTLNPELMELPATATKLCNSAWILSGNTIVKDGVTLVNSYGPELDTLQEGDCLGVVRTSDAELMFFVNGINLGVAATDLPPKVFAVIDLYGQCVQVTVVQIGARPHREQDEVSPNNDNTIPTMSLNIAGVSFPKPVEDVHIPMTSEGACALVTHERLRFHPRCGILVKLSSNNKTAERARPLDDYNNGVVMTHRPLYDNELFEIRIDRQVDKWSGSIEVGVTSHNPATIRFPSTMTNMDSGTIMMSGCKVLLNGHGTCMEYGNFNLDELREGDTVGMVKKSNGKLHYYINGVDQGVATDKVPKHIWGVVDLYGMTVKVTIVDPFEYQDSNINNPPALPSTTLTSPDTPAPSIYRPRIDENSLLFHTLRDSNVIIINDCKTAHRPNAFEYFNNGIVMTNRVLRNNELFQVRLDLVIPKWAGSIEIGVTQHSYNDIQFPFKMSNAKSGTWAMTGEDVIRDGTIIIPQYVRNLNRLVEGDTVGVIRKGNILHFYVNGVDQGPAAFNIPENIYGIVDLYGRVAQATIVDTYIPRNAFSPESPLSSESNTTVHPEMCFHRVHGRNARLSRNKRSATRTTVYSEFNDAVLFSSRPLRECDMFELRIDKMVDCWIGSLEIGVTAIRPDDLDSNGGLGGVAGTATDLNWDTYILSGAAMMKDGECVRSGYPLDLDTLTVGSRVGMMWHADRSLHYYLDGMDMGRAWYVPHLNIYAVVDLYGQCTQVTILQNEERAFNYNGCINSEYSFFSSAKNLYSPPAPYWSFSEYCGENIALLEDYSIARRIYHEPTGALVFSSAHLQVGEIFEIRIAECSPEFSGSFRMGVTDVNILNAYVNRSLPPSVSYLPHYTAYIDGKYLRYSCPGSKKQDIRSMAPSFEWLRPGDKLGLKKVTEGKVLLFYNTELVDITIEKVPDKVYVVMEMSGQVSKINAVTRCTDINTDVAQIPINLNKPKKRQKPLTLSINVTDSASESPTASQAQPVTASVEVPPEEVQSEETKAEVQVTAEVVATVEVSDEANPAKASESGVEAEQVVASTSTGSPAAESKKRYHPLPYTFHYVHGKNIKLCSSDTVAMRTTGYKDGIAIVSQPLRRGHNFRFRVDKVAGVWSGSACIGAVGSLPTGPLPSCSMNLPPPVWCLSSDLLCFNGVFKKTDVAAMLENITEQSVLSVRFRYNSELMVDVDGQVIGSIGFVPRTFGHVFPMIDLYGRVSQVSVLLHPYIVSSGTSLDLPIIAENVEDSLSEVDPEDNSSMADEEHGLPLDQTLVEEDKPDERYSEDDLMDPELDPSYYRAGPSTNHFESDMEYRSDTKLYKRPGPTQQPMHRSLMILDNRFIPTEHEEIAERTLHKSQSEYNFCHSTGNDLIDEEAKVALVQTLSSGSHYDDDCIFLFDDVVSERNARQNNRFPESSEVDNLDEIMDVLTLESCNLPDLTEEQSSSLDDSTRRDDIWLETLSLENLNYLNNVLCLDSEGAEGQSLESEWEASGANCEHLHLVLKYWNFLALPYPELRHAVSWGQARCYCANCHPDSATPLAGWVRIERIDGVGAARLSYWHVGRGTLSAAQTTRAAAANDGLAGSIRSLRVRRPRALVTNLNPSPPHADLWFDEEGKPHHTVLAFEIDVEGSDADNDRLLAFLIYLRPHVMTVDDIDPSLSDD